MYKLIEDILTDGFKLRKNGKLFSLKFYKAGDPDQTPIEDIDFVKGKAIVANGSYEIQQDGTFVGENQTPKSTGTDAENIFVEGSDTENIYINKEGKSNKEVHIRHFMVQEGENLQLYIAHKGTQYYEKINSIISSAKNVLMKFLPEEEIQKLLHNPVALSKMTPEDIAEMKESAEKKLQALKDKMNNIKQLFINAGASLTTDNIQELMTTIQKGNDSDNLIIKLLNDKFNVTLKESHVEDLMSNINSVIKLGPKEIQKLFTSLSEGQPIKIILEKQLSEE